MRPKAAVRLFLLAWLWCHVGVAGTLLRAGEHGDGFAERWLQIRDAATPAQLYALLYDLPKGGDLHHHVGGAGWPEDWLAIATDPTRNGGNAFYTRVSLAHLDVDAGEPPVLFKTIQRSDHERLPETARADYVALTELSPSDRGRWLSSVCLDRPGEGRDEFFELLWPRLGGLSHDPHVLIELVVQNMRRFGAEGVRYLEVQMNLYNMVGHDGRRLDVEDVARIYEERLDRVDARATGVEVRFQHSILRFKPDAEHDLEDTFAFLDQHRARWVGANLVGREDRQIGRPLRFLEPLRRLRRRYSDIPLSIHAGETDEPDHHVRETLLLGATRIGHGVNLIHDPDTMLLMRGQPYLVEVSLLSNRLLEYTPDLTKHPFPEYLRFGIPVCLNTDDRGMWGSDLTDEYFTAVTLYRLTWPEIVALGRNSLAYSFAQPELKQAMLADYERRVKTFEDKYRTAADWTTALPSPGQIVVSWYAQHNFPLQP